MPELADHPGVVREFNYERLLPESERPKVRPKGRRCKGYKRDCVTVLSVYNPGPYCFHCEEQLEDELAAYELRRFRQGHNDFEAMRRGR